MLLQYCKFCGSERIAPRFQLSRYKLQVLACEECRFLFVDYVNTNYLTPTVNEWDYESHAANLEKKFSAYCDHMEKYFSFAGKYILDVGAGGGDFLYQTKQRGAQPLGLDLDLTGIDFSQNRYGITILPHLVEETTLEKESFDAVTMWEVVEHVNDPQKTVAAIASLLKRGGYLFLSTPCLDSLWDRVGIFLYKITFGAIQFPLLYRFSWAHLQIFSRHHLEELLRRNGFTVIYFEQRTEFTYPSEMYLEKIKPKLLRKFLASIWDIFNRVLPIGNKMLVYARKE